MSHRLGGLAKRAQYIATHRKEAKGALVVDAGNLFLYRKRLRPKPNEPIVVPERLKARAAVIAEVYGRMKVDGVAVGALDLAFGADALKRLAARYHIPLLSANLQSAQGQRLFPAHRLVTAAGIRFGIFGLTGPHRIYKNLIDPKRYKLADLVATARTEVKTLRAQGAKIIIALAATGDLPARKLADEVPGIHFIFVSGTGRHRPNLEKRGTAFLSEMMPQGKYVGHLSLSVRGGSLAFQDMSQRLVIAGRIEQLEKSLSSLQSRMKRLGERGRKDYMQRRIRRTQGSLIRLRQQLYTANRQQPKGSYLTNVMVGVSTTLPDNPALAKLISERAKAAGLKRPRGVH